MTDVIRAFTRTRVLSVAIAVATWSAPAAAQEPPPARTDTFSGVWEARARNTAYGSDLVLRMELRQTGDSVVGTALLQYREQASEAPLDVGGVVRDGHLKLDGRFGLFHLTGSLRSGKIEARLNPGRDNEAQNTFAMTFARLQ